MNSEFGRIRTSTGLNVEDFARQIGCHASSIERIESGQIRETPELLSMLNHRLAVGRLVSSEIVRQDKGRAIDDDLWKTLDRQPTRGEPEHVGAILSRVMPEIFRSQLDRQASVKTASVEDGQVQCDLSLYCGR